MKKKFVCLVPLSSEAKFRFNTLMNRFHSCQILNETDNMLELISLNGEYQTKVPKTGNLHWKVIK